MRSILRISALILVLLALLVPLVVYAQVPCPDDPTADCYAEAPPYFVVTNRTEEHLTDRPGTGCQPFILANPDCKDCETDPECLDIDIDEDICQAVLVPREALAGELFELCCNCATDPAGDWVYREWYFDGEGCQLVSEVWEDGLPLGTGIDLPTPLIIGLAVILGAALLAAGLMVRRRSLQTA